MSKTDTKKRWTAKEVEYIKANATAISIKDMALTARSLRAVSAAVHAAPRHCQAPASKAQSSARTYRC